MTSATEENEFGLFGDMDIEDVPDDPWFVGAGTYYATVTKAMKQAKKDGSGYALIIEYTINEPDSDFHGQTKSDWFDLYPGRLFKDLDADEKKNVTRMKNRLMRAFDKTESELKGLKPDTLVGEKVYMKVVERQGTKPEHQGKTFSNIQDITSERKYEEQNPGSDNSVSAAGLSGA